MGLASQQGKRAQISDSVNRCRRPTREPRRLANSKRILLICSTFKFLEFCSTEEQKSHLGLNAGHGNENIKYIVGTIFSVGLPEEPVWFVSRPLKLCYFLLKGSVFLFTLCYQILSCLQIQYIYLQVTELHPHQLSIDTVHTSKIMLMFL